MSGTAALSLRVAGAILFLLQLVVVAPPVSAQTAATNYVPTMVFDVASIHEDAPTENYSAFGGFRPPTSGSFIVQSLTFKELLLAAYQIRLDQIVISDKNQIVISDKTSGNSRFTIRASVDDATNAKLATLTPQQRKLEQQHMVQSMLADRFHLKTHWETRTASTYDLVLFQAKSQLVQGTTQPAQWEKDQFRGHPVPSLSEGPQGLVAHGASMDELVEWLGFRLSRNVINKTGLTGVYSFQIPFRGIFVTDLPPDDTNPNAIPTLDIAFRNQLGLKIKPSKGPVPYLIIDHVEEPTPN
jgi:uncharacterized protein (TIGR03435 family)